MFFLKWFFLVSFIIFLLLMVSFFFFFFEKSVESSSPFECGIDPMIESKMPFFMHFFMVAILFLIFDVELALSIPLIHSLVSENWWGAYWLFFFFILFIGLAVEVFLSTIDWKE